MYPKRIPDTKPSKFTVLTLLIPARNIINLPLERPVLNPANHRDKLKTAFGERIL